MAGTAESFWKVFSVDFVNKIDSEGGREGSPYHKEY